MDNISMIRQGRLNASLLFPATLLIVLPLLWTACSSQDPPPVTIRKESPLTPGRRAPLTDRSCRTQNDCATIVQLWGNCYSYCVGEECDASVEQCEVFNRSSAPHRGFPCLSKKVCKRPEGKIMCLNQRCIVVSPEDLEKRTIEVEVE